MDRSKVEGPDFSSSESSASGEVYDFESREKVNSDDAPLPHFSPTERAQLLAEIEEHDSIANSWGAQLRNEKKLRELQVLIPLKQKEVDSLRKGMNFVNSTWREPKIKKAEKELQNLRTEEARYQDQYSGESGELQRKQDELAQAIKQKLGIWKFSSLKHKIYDIRKAELMAQTEEINESEMTDQQQTEQKKAA